MDTEQNSREKLPPVRGGMTVQFDMFGTSIVGVGNFYPDTRLAEVFLTAGKTGTHLQIAMADSAVAASLALQYGCPAETLRSAFLRTEDNKAAGPLGRVFDILTGAEVPS